MENNDVVNDPLTKEQASEANNESDAAEEASQDSPQKPGDKTPPNELLASLQVERERRRISEIKQKELEEQILILKNSSTSTEGEAFSDEGKLLEQKINSRTQALEAQLAELKEQSAIKDLLTQNPAIKEHFTEFQEYRENPDNKGMNLQTAAKAFMIENDLVENKKRVGLEKPTGNSREPSTVGKMTAADARKLRETNFKKYQDMVLKDQIQIVD
jgi:hypothetical protein